MPLKLSDGKHDPKLKKLMDYCFQYRNDIHVRDGVSGMVPFNSITKEQQERWISEWYRRDVVPPLNSATL